MTIDLEGYLAKAGHDTTRPRRVIFAVLAANHSLSIAQLVSQCAGKINRASVYRTLKLFEGIGLVERTRIGRETVWELCEPFSQHHHHAICERCGRVHVIREHVELEHELAVLARHIGFLPKSHTLEIRGLCPKCQA